MKKLILAVCAVFALSTLSFAQFGLGVKLGAGQNDPKDMKADFNAFGGTFTENPGIVALEMLYEFTMGYPDSANKIGIKVGLDFYGQNKLENALFKDTETTYAIPLTAYYKHDRGPGTVAFYGGGGVTFINTKIEGSGPFYGGAFDETEGKIFPHVSCGFEYRFTKLFAMGLDFKYNINAKVEKDGFIYSDRSGISGALAARFYF